MNQSQANKNGSCDSGIGNGGKKYDTENKGSKRKKRPRTAALLYTRGKKIPGFLVADGTTVTWYDLSDDWVGLNDGAVLCFVIQLG